jgi:hypothetical protein
MKSLVKFAMLTALLGAAVVEAQSTPPRPLPMAELKLRTDEVKKQIDGDNRHVLHLQALAKKEKDVIKLTCINDKLVQVKAQLDLFDVAALQIDGDDETAARGSFAEIEKIGLDVKKLRGEADGCAGELEMYKQESKADVERPELDDPTDGAPFHDPEQVGDPDVDVPGYATPYK